MDRLGWCRFISGSIYCVRTPSSVLRFAGALLQLSYRFLQNQYRGGWGSSRSKWNEGETPVSCLYASSRHGPLWMPQPQVLLTDSTLIGIEGTPASADCKRWRATQNLTRHQMERFWGVNARKRSWTWSEVKMVVPRWDRSCLWWEND